MCSTWPVRRDAEVNRFIAHHGFDRVGLCTACVVSDPVHRDTKLCLPCHEQRHDRARRRVAPKQHTDLREGDPLAWLFDAHRDGRLGGVDVLAEHYRGQLRPRLLRSTNPAAGRDHRGARREVLK